MSATEDGKLVQASAARLYGDGQKIWDPNDRWNTRKRAAIDAFAQEFVREPIRSAAVVVDVGCGSEPYSWLPDHTISLDRFRSQVVGRSAPVVGDIERLPFRSASVSALVCVASVLNYVSAAEAIAELARVLKPGGRLLLHFETSTSFEYLGKHHWGVPAARIGTVNSGRSDTLWVYRPAYIDSLLRAFGLRELRQRRFHILSSLGLRLGFTQQKAALLAAFDNMLRPLSFFSDDIILIAEKDS